MGSIAFELVLLLLLILVNGAFAMSEIAVVSSRKARLRQRAEAGDRGAAAALQIAREPADFLSTIQVGITLVGVLAGAVGGATLAERIADQLSHNPRIAPYGEAIGLAVVVIGVTYFSLILGELVPKRIALSHPERIAAIVAPVTRRLASFASPVVRLLTLSATLVLRLLRVRPRSEPPVTEEEIKVLIEQGAEAGVFDTREKEMVSRVLRLADRPVASVMTPRNEVVWIDLDGSPESASRKLRESGHSRLPVARGVLDRVEGVLRVVDWARAGCEDSVEEIASALRRPTFVPETTAALDLLKQFQVSREQLALVLDEHGSVSGLVTLHDLMEAIVGELPQIGEDAEPSAVQREDGSWLVDGTLPIEEFRALFRVPFLDEANEVGFHTVGGLVMAALRRIPRTGDAFERSGLRVEVLDMDGNRVDKVLVTRVSDARE